MTGDSGGSMIVTLPRTARIAIGTLCAGVLSAVWPPALDGRNAQSGATPVPRPPASSAAGIHAYSCGLPVTPPAGADAARQPVFPEGKYPVVLPPVSHLGARNDLPNPYRDGVDWGELPAGRKWGSAASVTRGPDGTIWVLDRCGAFGAGGTTCAGCRAPASIRSFSSIRPDAAEEHRRRPLRQPAQADDRQRRQPVGRRQRRAIRSSSCRPTARS